jgi:hypothetical protein
MNHTNWFVFQICFIHIAYLQFSFAATIEYECIIREAHVYRMEKVTLVLRMITIIFVCSISNTLKWTNFYASHYANIWMISLHYLMPIRR